MKRVLAVILLVLLLTAAVPATSFASDVRVYRVTASTLHLRTGPSDRYRIIAWMPTNTPLIVLGSANSNWYKVKTMNGVVGYAFKRYIVKNAYVNVKTASSGLNVRKRPSASSTYLFSLPHGARKITVTHINGNWAKVSYRGRTGYASRSYLRWYM